jgi:riboflavin biosynthesis pyrimidine reductase
LSAEVLDKFAELITFALGLVAALAWNEAIQQLFTQLLGEAGGALAAKFVYAVIVTLIVIFATIAVSGAAERRSSVRRREGEPESSGAREYRRSSAIIDGTL